MIRALPFLMAVALSSGAQARDRDALTVAGAVICANPFKLSEAIVAANRRDNDWVKSLGCARMRENVKVVLIDANAGLGDPWQVRMMQEGGPSITVWGYPPSFKSAKGQPYWSQK